MSTRVTTRRVFLLATSNEIWPPYPTQLAGIGYNAETNGVILPVFPCQLDPFRRVSGGHLFFSLSFFHGCPGCHPGKKGHGQGVTLSGFLTTAMSIDEWC